MVSLVSKESIEKQLKRIDFKVNGWGRSEVNELQHIILPGEEIYECVNGIYEGGFALLLATDTRVLLVDKKILSFLTVEDLRFDMINEIDFSHRLIGAFITIATGNKSLVFRSYNKERLRKLIGHVQHCMAEMKKQQTSHAEGQNQHLESINQQLQAYLMAQYTQQQKLQQQLEKVQKVGVIPEAETIPVQPEPVKPSPELADYLYANGLLREYQQQTGQVLQPSLDAVQASQPQPKGQAAPTATLDPPDQEPETRHDSNYSDLPWYGNDQIEDELYADGLQEVFGGRGDTSRKTVNVMSQTPSHSKPQTTSAPAQPEASALDVNPLKIAYSKLPQVLRSRKFGFGLGSAAFVKSKRTLNNQSQSINPGKPEPVAQH